MTPVARGVLLWVGLAAVACGGKVSVDDAETSAGSGGAGAFASVSSSGPGGPPGSTSGPDRGTSVGAGASGGVPTTGSGGGLASHLCYRLVDEAFVERIVLETGEPELVATVPPGFAPQGLPSPPAVRQDTIYDCSVGLLTRNDLITGTIEVSDVPCSTAAFLEEGVLAASVEGDSLRFYPSWQDVVAGVPDEVALPDYQWSRMGAEGDRVYFAWHSTSFVDRYSLASAGDLGPMPLEAFDGWVQGMDITADGLLVINGGISGNLLEVFDAETGIKLFDVTAQNGLTQGLTCDTIIPL